MMMINGSSHSTTVWKQISIKQNELADVSQALAERGLYAITLSFYLFFRLSRENVNTRRALTWVAQLAAVSGHSASGGGLSRRPFGPQWLVNRRKVGLHLSNPLLYLLPAEAQPECCLYIVPVPFDSETLSFWMCPFFLIFVIHISQYYWRKIYLIMSMSIFAKSLLLLKSHFYHQLWSDCILR